MPLKCIILDIDGTLVDSNDAHAQAFVEAMGLNGFAVSFEKIRVLIGMGSDKLLPEAIGVDAESDLGKKIGEEKKKIFAQKFLPNLKPTPGARELLERFREMKLTLVVATSAGSDEVKPLLKAAGVLDLIEEKTSMKDGESKPDPDIIVAALKKAEVRPKEAIMLGDTPYDVEASLKAGVEIIALRCGGWKDADLKGSAAIYDHPADLLARLESSPVGARLRASAKG